MTDTDDVRFSEIPQYIMGLDQDRTKIPDYRVFRRRGRFQILMGPWCNGT